MFSCSANNAKMLRAIVSHLICTKENSEFKKVVKLIVAVREIGCFDLSSRKKSSLFSQR